MALGVASHRSQSPRSPQGFFLYANNGGLLLQFVLTEFLYTYRVIQDINRIYSVLKHASQKRKHPSAVGSSLQLLRKTLLKLIGITEYDPLINSWTSRVGGLNKLKHYSAHLNCSLESRKKLIMDVKNCINKAHHSALHCQQLADDLQQRPSAYKTPSSFASLFSALDRLIRYTKKSAQLLVPLITSYHEDENVLFFLLTHRHEFDGLYQTDLVRTLFQKMYPEGINSAGEFIKKRYTERGFDSLLPLISQHIAHIMPGDPA